MNNSFVQAAIQQPDSFTENGADTFASSLNTHVDLFFRVGASRSNPDEVLELFEQAYRANADLAIRIALWARDVRGGAGEREIFRKMLGLMTPKHQLMLLNKIVEVGRWDDLSPLVLSDSTLVAETVSEFWKDAVVSGNNLAAKWCDRKGPVAIKLRKLWGMTPKQYRKLLVNTTHVVETQMCAKQWDDIEFSHVPSVASARYNRAFKRNATQKYELYKQALVDGTSKINASAIFPHDVIRAVLDNDRPYGVDDKGVDKDIVNAQWKALPDFCAGKASDILVMSDVSGSMCTPVSGSVQAIDISIALGLYISERQVSPFKDLVLTFSSQPSFHKVHGTNIVDRIKNLSQAKWDMSTDLSAAFKLILDTATNNDVEAEHMPKMLVILSDMEFNPSSVNNATNFSAMQTMYQQAGYQIPKVVFWNLNSKSKNVPVRFNQQGVALVSGFSPSIMKTILAADELVPEKIMLDAVMVDRYQVC